LPPAVLSQELGGKAQEIAPEAAANTGAAEAAAKGAIAPWLPTLLTLTAAAPAFEPVALAPTPALCVVVVVLVTERMGAVVARAPAETASAVLTPEVLTLSVTNM